MVIASPVTPARPARDPVLDGWRALAALGVVLSHYLTFARPGAEWHYLRLASRPLAETSVQLFFVISGFIITALMMRERAARGRVSLPAFYARRAARILPPLFAYLAVVILADRLGWLRTDAPSIAGSVAFACNTPIVSCGWWTAHSWSLAVEEQYYLVWPFLFAAIAPWLRARVLGSALILLVVAFAIAPPTFHSNFLSFACIVAGAGYAASPSAQAWLARARSGVWWIAVAGWLIAGPLLHWHHAFDAARPFLLVYLIFTAATLAPLRAILSWRPVQVVGAASYSLYLWQQFFLGPRDLYLAGAPPVWLLPIVVAVSVVLVERPFIRLGQRASAALIQRKR